MAIAPASVVSAQCALTELVPPDAGAGDLFGASMDAEFNLIVIGMPEDDTAGTNAGAAVVYIYDPFINEWMYDGTLIAADAAPNDQFATSVAINGTRIVIGAPLDDDQGGGSGSAYIFERLDEQWTQVGKVVAADGHLGDRFGKSVDVAGDQMIVGSYKDDDAGTTSGSAYIFERDRSGFWIETAKLVAADGSSSDELGFDVALSPGLALASAHKADENGGGSGAVYAWRSVGGAWVPSGKLLASDGQTGDWFGRAVDLSGETAIIGSHREDEAGSDAGAAYVFRFDSDAVTWSQHAKLQAPDADDIDSFGLSVAIDDDVIVVGTQQDDDNAFNAGAAHVFVREDGHWIHAAKLIPMSGGPSDLLGSSVAIMDGPGQAVAGAPERDAAGPDAGAVDVFSLVGILDCNGNGVADGCDIARGESLDEDEDGVPDACIQGDLNGDGFVDAGDLMDLIGDWGPCPDDPEPCAADLNGDGQVNIFDFLMLLGLWG